MTRDVECAPIHVLAALVESFAQQAVNPSVFGTIDEFEVRKDIVQRVEVLVVWNHSRSHAAVRRLPHVLCEGLPSVRGVNPVTERSRLVDTNCDRADRKTSPVVISRFETGAVWPHVAFEPLVPWNEPRLKGARVRGPAQRILVSLHRLRTKKAKAFPRTVPEFGDSVFGNVLVLPTDGALCVSTVLFAHDEHCTRTGTMMIVAQHKNLYKNGPSGVK